jgi:hypothetical protein
MWKLKKANCMKIEELKIQEKGEKDENTINSTNIFLSELKNRTIITNDTFNNYEQYISNSLLQHNKRINNADINYRTENVSNEKPIV